MGQHVTITLFGRSYELKADSDAVNTEQAADTLVDEVEKIQSHHTGMQARLSKLDVLILAAMNIAHENAKLKEMQSHLLKEVTDRSANIIKRLDRYLTQHVGLTP